MSKNSANAASIDEGDIRPAVRVEGNDRGVRVFAACLALFAVLLYYLLEGRRETAGTAGIEAATEPSSGRISSPPDLLIPRDYAQSYPVAPAATLPLRAPSAALAQPDQDPERQPAPAARRPARYPQYVATEPTAPLPYVPPIPQTTYDSGVARQAQPANSLDPASQQDRVKAFRFANPATTVAKGTIIEAVLETALDSTRPGFVRAIVSRDVVGFDGSRLLIPRGSRLVGEYKSDLAPGQNRALIQWQRLMRPDGVVINLDSPAIDPLGRAGVRGKVDSHFLERLAGAVLQSAVTIGSQAVLNRTTDNTVIYALPAAGLAPQVAAADRPQRTLKVKQGSSVSVFVVKDLDFTTVEQ